MKAEFTAVFRKVPEGYIGFVEELPGANTQGATLDEARRNLAEATQLVLEANRELAEQDIAGQEPKGPEGLQHPSTPRDQRVPRQEDLSGSGRPGTLLAPGTP